MNKTRIVTVFTPEILKDSSVQKQIEDSYQATLVAALYTVNKGYHDRIFKEKFGNTNIYTCNSLSIINKPCDSEEFSMEELYVLFSRMAEKDQYKISANKITVKTGQPQFFITCLSQKFMDVPVGE